MKKPGLTPETAREIAFAVEQDRADVHALMTRLNGYHTAPTCDLWLALMRKLDLLQVALEDGGEGFFLPFRPRGVESLTPMVLPLQCVAETWDGRTGEHRRKPLSVDDHATLGRYLKELRARYQGLHVQIGNAYALTFYALGRIARVESAISRLSSKLEDLLFHDCPGLPRATPYYYGPASP